MLGKILHDAAILFPEFQVYELLRSSAYDRALILSCRFHFSSALTTAHAKARGGQEIFAYWRSRHGRQFYPTGLDLTLIRLVFLEKDRIGTFCLRLWKSILSAPRNQYLGLKRSRSVSFLSLERAMGIEPTSEGWGLAINL